MNRNKTLILVLTPLFFAAAVAFRVAADESNNESEPETESEIEFSYSDLSALTAEQLYMSAFEPEIMTDERELILRELVEKHSDSRWADDALWMLGRLAEMKGRKAEAILWYQQLIENYPRASLEDFTKELYPYRSSSMPRILHVIDAVGLRYEHGRDTVFSFNPLPYSIHKELAQAYEVMGYYELAETEYKKSLENLPQIDVLRSIIKEKIDMLRRMQGTAAAG